jgi:hypothetical protein
MPQSRRRSREFGEPFSLLRDRRTATSGKQLPEIAGGTGITVKRPPIRPIDQPAYVLSGQFVNHYAHLAVHCRLCCNKSIVQSHRFRSISLVPSACTSWPGRYWSTRKSNLSSRKTFTVHSSCLRTRTGTTQKNDGNARSYMSRLTELCEFVLQHSFTIHRSTRHDERVAKSFRSVIRHTRSSASRSLQPLFGAVAVAKVFG